MRALFRFYTWLLLGAALPLALLFSLTSYASLTYQMRQPDFSLYGSVADFALTPGRYHLLRWGLAVVAGVAAGLLLATRGGPPSRGGAGPKLRRGWAALGRPWQQLGPAERQLAIVLGLVVAGERLYYAGYYPLSLDEIATYDYSVLPGAAVTASYYLFPNNHIFPNLLVGLVHRLLPGAPPELALRLLPTLLSLLSLPVVYLLALRHLRFGVATLGLGLFWLSPLAIYYAVAGRGYAWTLVAAVAGLFATLELCRAAARRPVRELAWGVFGLSGVLGLYAVPTHLYALLGLGLGLLSAGSQAPARVRGRRLAQLAGATLGLGVVVAVLYAPVGAVSGWPALLANRYVARHEWAEFRVGIGPFLVGTASELLGQRGLSAAAYLLLVLLGPVGLRWGQLPAPARRLGWLLYAQLVLWLLVVGVQHVYPPARTLLLVLLAFFLLAALLGQAAWLRWQPGPLSAAARGGCLALVLGTYGAYRLYREQLIITPQTQERAALRHAYAWLRAQSLGCIWVESRAEAIIWGHYARQAGQRPLPVVVIADVPAAQPGPGAAVQVRHAAADVPRAGQPVLYQRAGLVIVPVSPAQPLVRRP